MSGSLLRGPRWILLAAFCVAAGLTLAGTGRAGGDLDRFAKKQTILNQKTVGEIRDRIREARKIESKDPAQAKAILQDVRTRLDNAADLPKADRSDLERQIRTALASVEATVREQGSQARAAADRVSQKQGELDKRRDLEAQNKQGGAFSKSEDMITNGKAVLSQYEKLKLKREGGVVNTTLEVYKTNAQMEEQRITAAFIAAGKNRGQKLTDQEKQLLKMLNSTLSVTWDKTPLKDAIEFIQDKTNLNILVDEASLRDASVEYDDPVTLKGKKLPVRMILKKILADKGLTYIIKDACLHVMTPEKARQYTVTRAYPVADLLPVLMPQMGQFVNRVRMYQGVQQLMDLIVNTVEPASWQVNGGWGTVSFHEPSMSLLIRQTAEFHYQMGNGLGR
jgi:hypothetical protein